jgi:histidyl-tRNA synthetase
MNKYIVYVLEIHQVQIEVNALDEIDAVDQAANGNGRWVDNSMEFVDSVNSDEWIAELIEEGTDEVIENHLQPNR